MSEITYMKRLSNKKDLYRETIGFTREVGNILRPGTLRSIPRIHGWWVSVYTDVLRKSYSSLEFLSVNTPKTWFYFDGKKSHLYKKKRVLYLFTTTNDVQPCNQRLIQGSTRSVLNDIT